MIQSKAVMSQLANEPMQDYIKFLIFLRMGTNRSISKAFKQYYETTTDVSKAWYTLAEQYAWDARVAEYDKRNP